MESASGGQRSQQLKSRCIQRLALRVVPTRLAANDMLAIRGTLHLAACGVSNRLLTLLVVFTRTEDAEPEAPCG
jgi:hypothetical protein